MLRIEVITESGWAERLRSPWQSLADQDRYATPFQTWEWQSTWFRHFGRSKKPVIWTAWLGQDLVGLYPLVEIRSPWRALRPMGCGPSDYLQPLAQPALEAAVNARLAEFLDEESRTKLIDLHQLRESHPLAGALDHSRAEPRTFRQAECLVLDLPQSYEAYLKTLGKSLRYDVKRLDKSPFSSGSARIVPADETTAVEAVDFFLEAHKKRWSKRGLPGAFLGSRIRDFHREWAVVAAQSGWLWMSRLELEGAFIGAIYAMRFGHACYFYQSGFDPAHSAISPGSLLVAQTIRRAIEEGLTTFDFLRGDEPYKRRWKPQRSLGNLRLLMGEKAMLVKLGRAWNTAGHRVETKVRARFEGRGLK